jgi:hypothetical protein
MAEGNAIQTLALLALEKCLQRLGRVSAGNWRAAGVEVYSGGAADALAPYEGRESAAVYMVMEKLPLTSVLIVDPADTECISKAFTGHAFPKGRHITVADEVMLTELGNILINAMVNALLNALKITMLPELPGFAAGNAAAIAAALGPSTGPARVIEARLALDCGGPAAEILLFVLLPEPLAQRLN